MNKSKLWVLTYGVTGDLLRDKVAEVPGRPRR